MLLPKKLQSIGASAFSCCYGMKYLVVHSQLKEVGGDAFRGCLNLKGIVVVGRLPALVYDALIEEDCERTVFLVSHMHEAFNESNRAEGVGNRVVDTCGSVEEAVAVCGANTESLPEENLFAGLSHALKLAADGLVGGLPENHANVKSLDYFAGEMHKLTKMERAEAIKQYFFEHSQFVSDVGIKTTATFDILNDISITAEFKDGKLSKLDPSEGLQNAIREGMKIENVKPDESVLRWLR